MKLIDQYQQYGYVTFRKFFNDDELSLLESHVDRIYQKWRFENKTEIVAQKLVNMPSLTRSEYFQEYPEQRTAFFKAIVSKKLTNAIESMFDTDIYFHNTQLFFNPPNKECLPYWHRDMQYSSINEAVQREEHAKILSLHIRIPLLAEKGLEVIAGTHKRWDTGLERKVRLELDDHKNSESLPGSELIELDRGDILIFSAQMIHRGNYELSRERKALDICVGKYHPLTSDFLDSSVLPTSEEIANIDNNHWYRLAQEIVVKK